MILGIRLLDQTTITQLVLLGVSFLLLSVVGIERQRRLKSAGVRTHALVGVGATVFTLASAYGFAGVLGIDVVLDPSRIPAQIVTGVGFLGAGVIFVRQNAVNGLTAAPSIWLTAAIGMACGAGQSAAGRSAHAVLWQAALGRPGAGAVGNPRRHPRDAGTQRRRLTDRTRPAQCIRHAEPNSAASATA